MKLKKSLKLIHPFGDGNDRVGRIIIFKECLKNNILPFIVLDTDKPYYMRGLKKYKTDKMYLIDTIKMNKLFMNKSVINYLISNYKLLRHIKNSKDILSRIFLIIKINKSRYCYVSYAS